MSAYAQKKFYLNLSSNSGDNREYLELVLIFNVTIGNTQDK